MSHSIIGLFGLIKGSAMFYFLRILLVTLLTLIYQSVRLEDLLKGIKKYLRISFQNNVPLEDNLLGCLK